MGTPRRDEQPDRLTEYELDCQTLYAVPPPPHGALRFARYCGPTALAAVTNISAVQAADLLKDRMKAQGARRVVAATRASVCIDVLRDEFDARCAEPVTAHRRRGLRHFMGHFEGLTLVLVTGHFVAALGDMVVDTSCRYPTHIDDAPKSLQNKRVIKWWGVEF